MSAAAFEEPYEPAMTRLGMCDRNTSFRDIRIPTNCLNTTEHCKKKRKVFESISPSVCLPLARPFTF